MPDFFDRLLARHAPDAAGGAPGPSGGGAVARVRPRLPGPFERIDTLGARPAPPADVPPVASPGTATGAVPPFPPALLLAPGGREERPGRPRTAPADPPAPQRQDRQPLPVPLGPAPLLVPPPGVPAASPAPAAPEAVRPGPARRAVGGRGGPDGRPPRAGGETAAPPRRAVPAPVRPAPSSRPERSPADGGEGARTGGGRRRGRSGPVERVVHVSIGRLEVTAAGRTPAAARRDDDGARTARPAPALSLDGYLSREGGRR
ncbi:hypothetical protein [Streptomyces thermolineatus]|uniref:hypothetical protein n=1 Tax=Streptomyces thermolineatus TaxID=44033 RepID=UPI00384E7804